MTVCGSVGNVALGDREDDGRGQDSPASAVVVVDLASLG